MTKGRSTGAASRYSIVVCLSILAVLLACGPDVTPTAGVDDDPRTDLPDYDIRSLVGALSEERSHAYAVNDEGIVVGASGGVPVRWALDEDGGVSGPTLLTGDGGEGGPGEARDVNEAGTVVGWMGSDTIRPFVWDEDSGIRSLPLPDDLRGGGAYGVNVHGRIVGAGSVDPWYPEDGPRRLLVWTVSGDSVEAPEDLGTLGGLGATGLAINDDGDVAGLLLNEDGGMEGFVWTSSEQRALTLPLESGAMALNNRDEVVGAAKDRAAIWAGGGVVAFGPNGSVARGLNDAAVVVGESPLTAIAVADEDTKRRGFVLRDLVWTFLEGLSSIDHSRARDVNASGIIVGESFIPDVDVSDAVAWIPR